MQTYDLIVIGWPAGRDSSMPEAVLRLCGIYY
jgi:hypothetical protein